MKSVLIHKNFEAFAKSFRMYVRKKAIAYGNTITYLKDGKIIEENPKDGSVIIVKEIFTKKN